MASPLLRPVLEQWDRVQLPDAWLAAGAIAQTVWNWAHGLPPEFGINDIDLIYHDASDLSEDAEADHGRRIEERFGGVPARFDVKNEARVHLWYEAKFGYPIEPYESAMAAIATFPATPTAIGVRPSKQGLEICAPFGLDDLLGLVVRPNKAQVTRDIYQAKIDRWRPLWPRLSVLDWERSQVPARPHHCTLRASHRPPSISGAGENNTPNRSHQITTER